MSQRSPFGERTTRGRRGLLLLLSAAAAAMLAGCGVSTDNAPEERGAELAKGEGAPPAALTARPADTVEAEGSTLDAITPLAAGPFQTSSAKQVRFENTSSEDALAALCGGSVDLIELGETVTPAEAKACERNHLDLVGPLLIASDAAVIATKNEADIGGDCLTTGQIDDIFRAGSPYTDWSQLGFFDIPLSATGSLDEPVVDQLFALRALDSTTSSLSRSELRSDFIATPTAEETRRQIVGVDELARARALARERLTALRAEVAAQRLRVVEAAIARADRQVLRRIDAVNDRNRRLRIPVDAEALERHNAEMVEAAKHAAAARAGALFDARLAPRISRLTANLFASARTPGVVGFVRFTFYEQWEEQLRPVEVWDDSAQDTASQEPNCVFPSAQTVSSGHYPLAVQLLGYTTRQALARSSVRQYLLYLIGNAQRLAGDGGLVPITTQQRDANLLAIGVRPPESAPTAPSGEAAGVPDETASPEDDSGATDSDTSPSSEASAPPSGVPGVGSSLPSSEENTP